MNYLLSAKTINMPVLGIPLWVTTDEIVEKLVKKNFMALSALVMSLLNQYNIPMVEVCDNSKDVPDMNLRNGKNYFMY